MNLGQRLCHRSIQKKIFFKLPKIYRRQKDIFFSSFIPPKPLTIVFKKKNLIPLKN